MISNAKNSLLLLLLLYSCDTPSRGLHVDDPLEQEGEYVSEQYQENSDPRDRLYKIMENGLYGYVTFDGTVQIAPKFVEAGSFSSGLAPARFGGRYGYIDTKGEWVLPPKYDYAKDFSEGLASVWIDARAYIINLQGAVIHEGAYSDVQAFHQGLAVVEVSDYDWIGENGLINAEGEVLVPTRSAEYDIVDSSHILTHNGRNWTLIDDEGKVLHKYYGYEHAVVGYGSPVFVLAKQTDTTMFNYDVFSADGNIVGKTNPAHVSKIDGILRSGYMDAHRDGKMPGNLWGWTMTQLDNHGRAIPLEPDFGYALRFGKSLITVYDRANQKLNVYNTAGGLRKILTRTAKFDIALNRDYDLRKWDWSEYRFNADYGLLGSDGSFEILDERGRVSSALQISRKAEVIYIDSTRVVVDEPANSTTARRLVIFDWNGGSSPRKMFIDLERIYSIRDGIVTAVIRGKMRLIDLDGNVIWKSSAIANTNSITYSFDYKPNVWRFAYKDESVKIESSQLKKYLASNNLRLRSPQREPIQVFALQKSMSEIGRDEIEIVVVNTINDTITMEVSVSRLYLTMEARRSQSSPWVQIEHLAQSWCGNSFYSVDLPELSFWKYTVPRYSGDIQVECRMKLSLYDGQMSSKRNAGKQANVYSNTFRASINPGQLWRVNRHQPQGLWDPYL